jgi:hypothetical protein
MIWANIRIFVLGAAAQTSLNSKVNRVAICFSIRIVAISATNGTTLGLDRKLENRSLFRRGPQAGHTLGPVIA